MKALQFARAGALDHLRLLEVERPVPRIGEVLVRVEAAGLNPSDVKNVLGRFSHTTLPRIPGRDFAGVVVEGPPHLLGRHVFGSGKDLGFIRDGSHATFLTVSADGVSAIPTALTMAQAASCGVPYVTAWDGIARAQVDAGTRTVVIGAGAVGRAAIDLAKSRGADVAVAVCGAKKAAALADKEIGVVLLGGTGSLAKKVHAHFTDGADVIFDTTGAWLAGAVGALAPSGRVVVIAAPENGRVDFPALDLYRRGGSVIGVNSLLFDSSACAKILTEIGRGFDSGLLPLPPEPVEWPFGDAQAAYRAVETGGTGKLVLTGMG